MAGSSARNSDAAGAAGCACLCAVAVVCWLLWTAVTWAVAEWRWMWFLGYAAAVPVLAYGIVRAWGKRIPSPRRGSVRRGRRRSSRRWPLRRPSLSWRKAGERAWWRSCSHSLPVPSACSCPVAQTVKMVPAREPPSSRRTHSLHRTVRSWLTEPSTCPKRTLSGVRSMIQRLGALICSFFWSLRGRPDLPVQAASSSPDHIVCRDLCERRCDSHR